MLRALINCIFLSKYLVAVFLLFHSNLGISGYIVADDERWQNGWIEVCWGTKGYPQEKALIEAAVTKEVNNKTYFKFIGWKDCGAKGDLKVVRVNIAPNNFPKGTSGTSLNSLGDGDVSLPSLAFSNASLAGCRGGRARSCLYHYAVHEFGHVLGFYHEAARPDSLCKKKGDTTPVGAIVYGPYDSKSVMNYCNSGATTLSAGDLAAANFLYKRFNLIRYGIYPVGKYIPNNPDKEASYDMHVVAGRETAFPIVITNRDLKLEIKSLTLHFGTQYRNNETPVASSNDPDAGFRYTFPAASTKDSKNTFFRLVDSAGRASFIDKVINVRILPIADININIDTAALPLHSGSIECKIQSTAPVSKILGSTKAQDEDECRAYCEVVSPMLLNDIFKGNCGAGGQTFFEMK